MVIKPDAIGRERLRCPRCDGVSAPRPRHPDDAMLPQGLIPSSAAVRIVERIVRVSVPAEPAPPMVIIELPAIEPGQLRCQVCARGVDPEARFCDGCKPPRPKRVSSGPRTYREKPCAFDGCETVFQPSGPNARFCEAHR